MVQFLFELFNETRYSWPFEQLKIMNYKLGGFNFLLQEIS